MLLLFPLFCVGFSTFFFPPFHCGPFSTPGKLLRIHLRACPRPLCRQCSFYFITLLYNVSHESTAPYFTSVAPMLWKCLIAQAVLNVSAPLFGETLYTAPGHYRHFPANLLDFECRFNNGFLFIVVSFYNLKMNRVSIISRIFVPNRPLKSQTSKIVKPNIGLCSSKVRLCLNNIGLCSSKIGCCFSRVINRSFIRR